MNVSPVPEETLLGKPVAPRFRRAIWTLLVLSPFIAEVLSGATRVSVLFVLIPEIMVWGVGRCCAGKWFAAGEAGARACCYLAWRYRSQRSA
jgi:hypothetical protein